MNVLCGEISFTLLNYCIQSSGDARRLSVVVVVAVVVVVDACERV